MGKHKRDFYRCACCDKEFSSEIECREHFESDEHNMIAVAAWIRYVAWMYRDGAASFEIFDLKPRGKSLDNVLTL